MLCGMTATRDNNRSGRVPAGAAVLQADVTEAIRQALRILENDIEVVK
jgi:hypothetical protein